MVADVAAPPSSALPGTFSPRGEGALKADAVSHPRAARKEAHTAGATSPSSLGEKVPEGRMRGTRRPQLRPPTTQTPRSPHAPKTPPPPQAHRRRPPHAPRGPPHRRPARLLLAPAPLLRRARPVEHLRPPHLPPHQAVRRHPAPLFRGPPRRHPDAGCSPGARSWRRAPARSATRRGPRSTPIPTPTPTPSPRRHPHPDPPPGSAATDHDARASITSMDLALGGSRVHVSRAHPAHIDRRFEF